MILSRTWSWEEWNRGKVEAAGGEFEQLLLWSESLLIIDLDAEEEWGETLVVVEDEDPLTRESMEKEIFLLLVILIGCWLRLLFVVWGGEWILGVEEEVLLFPWMMCWIEEGWLEEDNEFVFMSRESFGGEGEGVNTWFEGDIFLLLFWSLCWSLCRWCCCWCRWRRWWRWWSRGESKEGRGEDDISISWWCLDFVGYSCLCFQVSITYLLLSSISLRKSLAAWILPAKSCRATCVRRMTACLLLRICSSLMFVVGNFSLTSLTSIKRREREEPGGRKVALETHSPSSLIGCRKLLLGREENPLTGEKERERSSTHRTSIKEDEHDHRFRGKKKIFTSFFLFFLRGKRCFIRLLLLTFMPREKRMYYTTATACIILILSFTACVFLRKREKIPVYGIH